VTARTRRSWATSPAPVVYEGLTGDVDLADGEGAGYSTIARGDRVFARVYVDAEAGTIASWPGGRTSTPSSAVYDEARRAGVRAFRAGVRRVPHAGRPAADWANARFGYQRMRCLHPCPERDVTTLGRHPRRLIPDLTGRGLDGASGTKRHRPLRTVAGGGMRDEPQRV